MEMKGWWVVFTFKFAAAGISLLGFGARALFSRDFFCAGVFGSVTEDCLPGFLDPLLPFGVDVGTLCFLLPFLFVDLYPNYSSLSKSD